MAAILIVEDEEKIARFVELELQHEGYETGKAADGASGLSLAESGRYDLMVLDIMLPGINGLEVLRRLRKTSDMPVILLTARDAVMDKVSGLEMGADDYITKPFAIEALRKAAKQKQQIAETVFSCKGVELRPDAHEVTVRGKKVELTIREFTLLQTLLEHKNIVMSRDTLIDRVWGCDYYVETNIVDVYIRYLRHKIDDRFQIHLISTVRGIGYVIKEN